MIDNLSIFCNKLNMPDPRNTNFEGLDLDPKIKDFVININKSNWIYTLFSCQGHNEENNITKPYFVFIVDNDRIKEFLFMIYETLPPSTYNPNMPFAGDFEFQISKQCNDNYYSMVAVHWDIKCADNETFYNNLNTMAYTINNFLKANNNNDKEHLQKQLNIMQRLQEAYSDNPHRKYQYSVEEKFIKEMIQQHEQKNNDSTYTETEIIK